jgi:hypothetical protein
VPRKGTAGRHLLDTKHYNYAVGVYIDGGSDAGKKLNFMTQVCFVPQALFLFLTQRVRVPYA